MDSLDILQKFLISDKHPWMTQVFIHQGFWSVAVNSSCFLAFKGEVGGKIENPPLLPLLQQSRPKKALRFDIDWVRAWVTQITPQMQEFDIVPIWATGIIAGVKLDLRKLAFILSLLPPEDLFVWDSTRSQGAKSIGFECDQWRGCLAGVDGELEDCSNIFKPPPVKSNFDMMMELESE